MRIPKRLFDGWRLYQLGIFRVALNRLFSGIFSYNTFILYSYDLRKEKLSPPQQKESFSIQKVHSDRDELFKRFHKKFPANEFVSRIKSGRETAYLVIQKTEITAYAWVTEKELYIDAINYTFPLNNDELFLYSCFVCRESRGKRIHNALLYQRLKDFSKNGRYKIAYTGALSVNKGSIKGIEKAGFKKCSKIRYLKFFNLEKRWGLSSFQ